MRLLRVAMIFFFTAQITSARLDTGFPKTKQKIQVNLNAPSIPSIAAKATEDYDCGWGLGHVGTEQNKLESGQLNVLTSRLTTSVFMTANIPMTETEKLEPRKKTTREKNQPTRQYVA